MASLRRLLVPTMALSDYCPRAMLGDRPAGSDWVKLIDHLGADRIMGGTDFPHPDGIWPDSREHMQKGLGHLPADVRHKVVCENAGRLYRFPIA